MKKEYDYIYSYFTELFKLQVRANKKGLELQPHFCIKCNYEDAHLDELFDIYDIETGEQLGYVSFDSDFDDGLTFTYDEVELYIDKYDN